MNIRSVDPGVVSLLVCPVCVRQTHRSTVATGTHNSLDQVGRELVCERGHSFPIAKQGYISLLSGVKPTSSDDDAMSQARDRFLSSGAYAPLADALAGLAHTKAGTFLDAGCGTGYYAAQVLTGAGLEALGVGFDTSVRAVRIAARAHPQFTALTWDVYKPLPFSDASFDAVINVFSPRNVSEFARVLKPDGKLIVVRPAAAHLQELRTVVAKMVAIDPHKEQRLTTALKPYFEHTHTEGLTFQPELSALQCQDLIAMTPSARHIAQDQLDALTVAGQVTVSVLLSAWSKPE